MIVILDVRDARTEAFMRRSTYLVAVLAVLAASSAPASAQTPWRLGAGGGLLSWDASGTGESPTVFLRADRPLSRRWLGVELGASYAGLDEQFSTATTHTLAIDGQLQLQTPPARVQPYLGVGPALFSYVTQRRGRDLVEIGYTAGVGLRLRLADRLGLVMDGRIRGWDFENATDFTVNVGGEATVGLTYRP